LTEKTECCPRMRRPQSVPVNVKTISAFGQIPEAFGLQGDWCAQVMGRGSRKRVRGNGSDTVEYSQFQTRILLVACTRNSFH
jgi:hypothetical protein